MKILLMEDDPVLGDIVSTYLQEYYEVSHVFDSKEAQELIDENHFDLFIFDINVPGKSGIELLEELRSFNDTTPAIVVTAYVDTKHLKESFDAGAHDYIKKPFELEELKLRIEKSRVLFHIEQDLPVKIDEQLTYYPRRYMVSDGNKEMTLRPKEAEILDYFIAHSNRLISQEELIQNIWDFEDMPSDATLRSYIRKLREIIGFTKIVTQRGMGYRYE
ncbi:DNA-binding response regulator [hydrothermal vent metagenome]|uniref:DNA-binding response regulator n=1 Tax=hydrothermal vent metagenome TaxID=652676 RepID=A0A1W1EC19_9ZZZZ